MAITYRVAAYRVTGDLISFDDFPHLTPAYHGLGETLGGGWAYRVVLQELWGDEHGTGEIVRTHIDVVGTNPDDACLTGDKIPAFFLHIRTLQTLERAGITTLGQITSRTRDEFAALEGIGPATVAEISRAMAEAGLSFRTH